MSLASIALDVDFFEDEGWGDKFYKATHIEIATMVIDAILKQIKTTLPVSEKLYVVAFESCLVSEGQWETLLADPDSVMLWTEREFCKSCGWSDDELNTLNDLKVGRGVNNFSSQCHSIFRLS